MNKYNSTAVRYHVDAQEVLRIARHKTSRNRLLLLINKWQNNVWQKFKFNSNVRFPYQVALLHMCSRRSFTMNCSYTSMYVARNLRICRISRLCCAFSESQDCVPISRLHKGHSMSNQHKKSLPPPIWTKIGSYTVSVETLIHSEFQRSMLYGFRVRTRRKLNF